MKRIITLFTFFLLAAFVTMSSLYGRTKIIVRQGDDYVKVFARKNAKYVIKEDIDLDGKKVIIGTGSELVFKGGSLANGTIVGRLTYVKAGNYEIFKRGYTRYRAYINPETSERFPPSLKSVYHNWLIIEGTWVNKKCGSKWTGLLNNSDEDIMPAVKNYVTLHASGAKVILPSFEALGYEQTKFPGNHIIDFNNSVISYPDTLSIWEDETIVVPKGAIPCTMESGYGLITLNHNTTIKNLSVDGKSSFRQNEKVRLGVSNIICIGNSQNVTLENINLSNVLGPAMVAHPKSKDLTFDKCRFYNIGEHVMYSQQYLGFCHFIDCTFDTWDSERISVFRNETDYIYKHTPLEGRGDATYDDLYRFDLVFKDCIFNNPERVNSQGRMLGSFFTGNFPVVVKLVNCKFIGVSPKFNPGGAAEISEKTGKMYKMIISGCDGAPYAYASNANYNIIAEFYNCINIPLRTVYAKRYENCKLFFDLYEVNIENVSSSCENEFKKPLVIKDCEFTDNGNDITINHPILHRPLIVENSHFFSTKNRNSASTVFNIIVDSLAKISFTDCVFDLPGFRLVGGDKYIDTLTVQQCKFKAISTRFYELKPKIIEEKDNYSFSN